MGRALQSTGKRGRPVGWRKEKGKNN